MRRVAAFTGILNLDIRKPCWLIFFSVVEEVVASRAILLKMTIYLLGTHFPNPVKQNKFVVACSDIAVLVAIC